ncbi:MAG TPA: TadE family protein [Acidobacteriaceae bacterium]|jgi:Flp pilus assembly protein TadG
MFRRGDRGQSLVEVALAAPILILMLLGAAEFARIAFAGIEVSNAARAAVAYGAQSTATAADAGGIQTAAAMDAGDMAASLTATATVTGVCSSGSSCTGAGSTCLNTDCDTPGDHIETILTVDTAANFDPLIHVPGLPTTFSLHGHAVQKCLP